MSGEFWWMSVNFNLARRDTNTTPIRHQYDTNEQHITAKKRAKALHLIILRYLGYTTTLLFIFRDPAPLLHRHIHLLLRHLLLQGAASLSWSQDPRVLLLLLSLDQ